MATNEIRVFYSWQSDLPGNTTRSLIQEAIDTAVKALRDTVEVVSDRDTKGVTGTPDITETIFKKIAESDLFIADISIINKYSSYDDEGNVVDDIKCSPNPNVLTELGFAAGVLGWDNVICIINTDYGSIEDLPFDLAHRRPYAYSLKTKDKSTVKKKIRGIIVNAVMSIVENGPRAKAGHSNLLVGIYDFMQNSNQMNTLPLLTVQDLPGYTLIKKKLYHDSTTLIHKILGYPELLLSDAEASENMVLPIQPRDLLSQSLMSKLTESKQVLVSQDERLETMKTVKELFDIDLPDAFFMFGSLKKKVTLYPSKTEYIGSEDEKKKYDDYEEFRYLLLSIRLLDIFIRAFDGIKVLPLFIVNSSSEVDEDITVSIRIEQGIPVEPSKALFHPEYRSANDNTGLEDFVYELGLIKDLLLLPDDRIQYDTDISYSIEDQIIENQRNVQRVFSGRESDATAEDYVREIGKFIAKKKERAIDALYEFEISGLRPQETKWLGPLILVQPTEDGKITIAYTIKSAHSPGIVDGRLMAE